MDDVNPAIINCLGNNQIKTNISLLDQATIFLKIAIPKIN